MQLEALITWDFCDSELLWLTLFFLSHLIRNPRENICKMHIASSNYLLLKARTTLESVKCELKMWLCIKFDYCLLKLIILETANLSLGLFISTSPCHLNKWDAMFLLCPTIKTQDFYKYSLQANYVPFSSFINMQCYFLFC